MSDGLKPCPCCGEEVELSSTRDCNIGSMNIICENKDCKLYDESLFSLEFVMWCSSEKDRDFGKEIIERYNDWWGTDPDQYRDVCWENN